MEWHRYATEIKDLLELPGSPVAITFSMDGPSQSSGGKHRACEALIHARDGKIVDLTRETSTCPGGSTYLGFQEAPKGDAAKALKEFLVSGEKLFCSIAVFERARSLSPPSPTGLADHVVFSPMEAAEFCPDLVLFICNAVQACRLVTLDLYDTGIPPRIHMAGATCQQAISYPLVTGELNVSLMDFTSRRIKGYRPEDLLVTIPYHRFHGVIRSIPRCTAGTAKMEIPESFRRMAGDESLEGLDR